MKLTELYRLRKDFTIIGLTGRTGSGCTKVAKSLSSNLDDLIKKADRSNSSKNYTQIQNPILKKKINICKKFLESNENWQPFEIITYKNVLLFHIIKEIGENTGSISQLIHYYYKDFQESEVNRDDARIVIEKLMLLFTDNRELISSISQLPKYTELRGADLTTLNNIFWGDEFKKFSSSFFEILENQSYLKRTYFLHCISTNIRNTGTLINLENKSDIEHIYTLSELINRIIKARKQHHNNKRPTRIVIDSLRNSLEIMFFKERYSAFYMIATKDGNHKTLERLKDRLPNHLGLSDDDKEQIARGLIKLDSIEYQNEEYTKGKFANPDVSNCIQKSEIHIVNTKLDDIPTTNNSEKSSDTHSYIDETLSTEEQILKIISLILQPGIITPSARERCMQVAYNAKFNSGCISRQVGAVVTDSNYALKAMGWNDVPHGQTPCNLRDINDLKLVNSPVLEHYSDFERGNVNNIDIEYKYKDKFPKTFPKALEDYFKDSKTDDLEGRTCSFCFKAIHNHYEGEKNQVHTRSLHAEENAMLQIAKYGGQALKGGVLFTTASPCELCSKKAVQLGISKIYYIDPYPGISTSQILSKNKQYEIQLISFNGAVGKSYNRLYEPFMSYKDELAIILENNPKKPKGENIEIRNSDLKKLLIDKFANGDEIDQEKLLIFLTSTLSEQNRLGD